MRQILKTYQTKLTNLSASNKSLLQLRAYKQADLDLHELNFLSSEASIKIIEKLLLKKTATLCLVDDPRSEHNNLMSKRLQQISNRVRFIQNERGTDDLYLAYPFIQGKLKSGFPIRCPLFFVPVKLNIFKNQWQLSLQGDTPIKFNRSFLLAYAYYHETKLDKALDEVDLLDLGYEDLKGFLLKLYEALKASDIELNFNSELFEEQLKFFENYKKADFENEHQDGVLKLQAYAVLGIYPQAGSNMFSDYENLIENCNYPSLEEYFSTKITERFKNKEESFFTPFPIDASQEEALKLMRSGKSIVVQGPPGTGKSQLIAQVIADYLANGKKILLTCDKRVALDVVYSRLQSIALEKHIGLVHDYNTDRKKLYEKISQYLENLEHTQTQNNKYDTISLERDFLQVSRRITQIEEELDGLKTALFDDTPFGVSAKHLYLNTQKQYDLGITSLEASAIEVCKNLDYNSLHLFLGKLKYWLPKALLFEDESFILQKRKSFQELQSSDAKQVFAAFVHKNKLHSKIQDTTQTILNQSLTILELEDLHTEIATHDLLSEILKSEEVFDLFVAYQDKKLKKERLDRFYALAQELLTKGIVHELDIPALIRAKDLLQMAFDTLTASFGKLRFYISYQHRKELKAILVKHKSKLNKVQVGVLLQKINHTISLVEAHEQLKKSGFVVENTDITTTYNLEDWYTLQKTAFDALTLFRSLPEQPFKNMLKHPHQQFLTHQKNLITLYQDLTSSLPSLRRYLADTQLEHFHDEHILQEQLSLHFDAIAEFDSFSHGFNSTEKTLAILSFEHAKGADQIDVAIEQLKNQVYTYWISQIEEKHPILKSVSTGYVQILEDELKEALKNKQKLSAQIVPLKASEDTYKNLEYNRLGNRTTYRDLLHETTKKKKIKSVRQLFEAHMDEVLQLIPCWMASPETVSAIFPNLEIFDLVIFDEASQCFTEEAVPTLFRGRQVLVAGDSKQLAPIDLYRPRWEDEDENIDEQTNSLLDLACRYLPQTTLKEHYRSLSYELIHFSNQKFYQGSLRLIPDRKHFNKKQRALEYVKVYGIWQQQSNYLEAVECLRLVKKHLFDPSEKSIGIITFNFKQQELIQDLLLEDSIKENYTLPESLFVKNIENVQGDERDIIICSVAYAPNEDGKMVSSFGSLAMAGGENRLNVAITRAKEKMYVVASILPQQLQTENAKNQGPFLLKAYLEYVWKLNQEHLDKKFIPEIEDHSNTSNDYLASRISSKDKIQGHGFADIIEFKDGDGQAVIITDDNIYYKSRSAKEIHGYIPNTLQSKSWPISKYYSRLFYEGKLTP